MHWTFKISLWKRPSIKKDLLQWVLHFLMKTKQVVIKTDNFFYFDVNVHTHINKIIQAILWPNCIFVNSPILSITYLQNHNQCEQFYKFNYPQPNWSSENNGLNLYGWYNRLCLFLLFHKKLWFMFHFGQNIAAKLVLAFLFRQH